MTGPLPIIQAEWATIRAEQEKYCAFAKSQASALGEHLLHNRLANVGPKGLTGMLELLKAARQAAAKCTTPPAEVTHCIAF